MRLTLALLVALAVLLGIGWWLLPLLVAHAPGLLGGLGVLLLLVALVLPGKRRCEGFHCSGCNHH
jgi:hypothetical protein